MSSDIAIKVEGLSKCYQIYEKPGDRLKQFIFPRLQRLIGRVGKHYFREFWALKDISFVVRKGETVGIIGHNGSGKSTLLQIICQTLNNTTGSVFASGRVAALLELGAGFNLEFSGRENIFLNAAILGLSEQQIHERFERIVTYANIGDFIDQPVKTYSSGMYVRLAFAIAVHVDANILVIDEALSVGDFTFRNKCMETIKELITRGVTVLFVTHDLSTLQLICNKAIWIEKGEVKAIGDPIRIVQDYYSSSSQCYGLDTSEVSSLPAQQETGIAKIVNLTISPPRNNQYYIIGDSLTFSFAILAERNIPNLVFAISIYREDGDWVIGQTSKESNVIWHEIKAGDLCKGELTLSPLSLTPGNYLTALGAYSLDFTLCYALTDLSLRFSVKASRPTWGKFIHPCTWSRIGEQP